MAAETENSPKFAAWILSGPTIGCWITSSMSATVANDGAGE